MSKKMIAEKLNSGEIVVMPSDTIMGIFASVKNPRAVAQIAHLKNREAGKTFLVLFSDLEQLTKYGIHLSDEQTKMVVESINPTTIILTATESISAFLNTPHTLRSGTIAIRIPKDEILQSILWETGPLVAPSANPEGLLPAENEIWAKKYFGDEVSYFIPKDWKPSKKPSEIWDFTTPTPTQIR